MFSNNFTPKKPLENMQIFVCEVCYFNTSNKKDYNRHLFTKKHKNNISQCFSIKKPQKTPHACSCGKIYSDPSGLWRHKKKCTEQIPQQNLPFDKEIMMELIKNNAEVQKMMMDVIKMGTHNTNCNNLTNNKTFNLNVYLNETCKDAMNISDFVSSIKLNLEDLENTGRKGYVEGISSILLKNLNNIEHHMRPIHCSDQKREILYIKDNDKWEKECDDKPILTKAIKNVANENIKQIKCWRDKNPDCTSSTSKKNDLYLKIVSNSMNGLTEEEGKKNINKIISNVAKEVVIDKN
jgi:hypothetical protein